MKKSNDTFWYPSLLTVQNSMEVQRPAKFTRNHLQIVQSANLKVGKNMWLGSPDIEATREIVGQTSWRKEYNHNCRNTSYLCKTKAKSRWQGEATYNEPPTGWWKEVPAPSKWNQHEHKFRRKNQTLFDGT